MRSLLLAGLCLALGSSPSSAQTAADTAGIREAALNYGEGWYEGNPDRIAKAVHPELVKRIVTHDTATKRSLIQNMGFTHLVNNTRRGGGKNTPVAQQEKTVAIYDIFGNTAVARLTMSGWIDYMQLAKIDGKWIIVNVLWELKPR
jgi:hypothetical protein